MQVTITLLIYLIHPAAEIHTETSQPALLKSKLGNFHLSFISLLFHQELLQEKVSTARPKMTHFMFFSQLEQVTLMKAYFALIRKYLPLSNTCNKTHTIFF